MCMCDFNPPLLKYSILRNVNNISLSIQLVYQLSQTAHCLHQRFQGNRTRIQIAYVGAGSVRTLGSIQAIVGAFDFIIQLYSKSNTV